MKKLSGSRTAVYSGVMTADYQEIAEGDLFRLGDHPGSGTAKSILANRISWFFDLRGPSLSLDTACSSALYSLHLACQAVQAGECDQALVTGTNLILHPNLMAQFTAMHMITPDRISHTFDESANGYGRGEGVAAVIVKPLKDAIRDGDVVRAVIRATGANFDGKTTGMTVPSGDAQAELIRETYKKAGISMNDTCYFEAHGTGTPLGDPIEMQAIAKTIGSARKCANNGPLYVGSVKPNVGHTGGAAGLAGLIKAVLCLEADSPASIGDDTASERAQDVEHQDHLFVFSAQDQGSLSRVASGYAEFLKDEPYKDDIVAMQSLSHILSEKRTKLDFRSFVVAHSLADLSASLEANQLPRERSSPKDKAIFVFTGQGAQRSGMARELLSDPVFSESIRLSQKVVIACGGDWDIEHMLTTGTAQELGNPLYSQPLCTAIQIGLVDMLSSWNVQPAAVIGHSSGEIAAAYSSGVLSHEDAMYVAYYRGTLSSVVSSRAGIQGSMLAAGISESEAAKYVIDKASVTIACINSPSSVTLSGESSAIAEVHDALVNDGKFSRQLRTGVAYHSSYMAVVSEDNIDGEEPLDTEYSAIIEIGPSKTLQGPIKQILTAVSPRLAKKLPYRSMLVAGSHARKTSLEAAGFLWSTGHSIDLGKVNRISAASELDLCMLPRLPMYPWNHENSFWHEHLASNAVRLRKEPRTDFLGMPVDGQNPFEPRWRNLLSVTENPWLGHHRVASACLFPAAGYLVMAVEAVLKLAAKDVQKGRVLRGVEITDVTFETGLALSEDGSATGVSITLKPRAAMDATYDFSIYSDSFDQPVRRLVVGSIAATYEGLRKHGDDGFEIEAQQQEWEAAKAKLQETQSSAIHTGDVKAFYAKLASVGLEYGPTFQALERIDTVSPLENEALFGGTACGTLTVPDTKAIMPMEYEFPHLLHPATLDSAFHLAFTALQTREDMLRPAVPVSIQRCFISADLPSDPGSKFFGMASIKRIGKTALVTDIFFADAEVNGPQIVIESMGLSDVGEVSTQDAGYGTANLAGSNRRAADVVWKEDVTLMQLPSDTNLLDNESPLSSWLECFLHKYSNANILFAGAERSMPLLETLKGQAGISLTVKCMDQIPIHTNNSYIISLVEYGQGLVCDWGEEELVQFQNLVASARYVLWLTTGGLMAPNEDGLKYSLTQGLLRTVRAEYPQLVLPHLDISPDSTRLYEEVASITAKILAATLSGADPTVVVEAEYAELNCKIFIPRLVRDVAMDAEIELLSSNSTTIEIQLNDCRQPLRLSTATGSVQWRPCEPYSSIGAGEVLVETRYVPGSTSKMAPMPWTIVGVVREVGDCVSQYRVGDFVIPLDISGDLDVKTSFLINASDILRVPKNISATQLAYWITPFIVAHRVLINQQQSSSSTSYGALSDAKIFTHLASDLSMKLQPNYTPPESAGNSPPRSSTPELRERQQADAGGVLIDVEDSALRTALGQTAHWLGLETFIVVPESE
ncbi:Type I Iterative PKS [Trichoderma virens]|nr:Type I Iterative PKS [Trichoderma virens]